MNAKMKSRIPHILLFGFTLLFLNQCERVVDGLEPPPFPSNPEIFIDGFSGGLNYAAFGGSVPTAFQVDNETTYGNSKASMRFEVPDVNDSRGTYAGGTFFTASPRDLSQYDALTFWAKSTQATSLDIVGFGNDLGENRYQASVPNLDVNTNWKKYIIPIPSAARLTAERGMFFYSVGPKDGKGFTFWIDEVKYEKLGTIAHPLPAIMNGENQVVNSFAGVSTSIVGLQSVHNLPNGTNLAVDVTPNYFQFSTSNSAVATVDAAGRVSIVGGPANAVITAKLGNQEAKGSLTIQSRGQYVNAPTPTRLPNRVISLFSDAYQNVPVDYYNGYWAPFQTTQSADFRVGNDNVLHYTNFNFVGIQFSSPTINATSMTHLHVDIFLPNPLSANARLKFEMVNSGSGGTGAFTRTIVPSDAQKWISLDIPLTSFAGLTNRSNLFQLIFVSDSGNIPSIYVDNVYFYQQ
jgi:hypothetical protein